MKNLKWFYLIILCTHKLWVHHKTHGNLSFDSHTYISISPYRTLAVAWTEIYGNYVICDVIVWENTNVVHFLCDMGKYTTCPMNKGSHLINWTSAVFSHIALKWTPFAYHRAALTFFMPLWISAYTGYLHTQKELLLCCPSLTLTHGCDKLKTTRVDTIIDYSTKCA